MRKVSWAGNLKPSNRLVVADAGPLIALARLELLGLPARLFQVAVTAPVLAECEAKPDRGEGQAIREAIEEGSLRLVEVPAVDHAWGIDAGESSAIAFALEMRGGVLMDDKAGRVVAARLGCPVLGTVGLLVLGKRHGFIAALRPSLDRLRQSGYFLGDALVDDALRLVGE